MKIIRIIEILLGAFLLLGILKSLRGMISGATLDVSFNPPGSACISSIASKFIWRINSQKGSGFSRTMFKKIFLKALAETLRMIDIFPIFGLSL